MISIVICTYNRSDILNKCVESVVKNISILNCEYELLIVDNNSNDNTKDVIKIYQNKYLFINYINEKQIGLSYARNRGIQSSSFEWIVFIDDDCKTEKNFFNVLEETIQDYNFDAFTGSYLPWFMDKRPKWLPSDFGKKEVSATETTSLRSPDSFSGGILALKREALLEIGCFNHNLGMQGSKQGYGEEIEVQKKLKEKGYLIGINPSWYVLHLVRSEKFKVRWHLKRQYAAGRDHAKIDSKNSIMKIMVQPIYAFLRTFVPMSIKLISKKNYYWQNYILDLFGIFYRNLGILKTRLLPSFKAKDL